MNWFLCTITATGRHNWDLAQEHRVWGIPTLNKTPQSLGVVENDKLVFWLARSGYVGIATVEAKPFKPFEKKQAPWAGGTFRYGITIPVNFDTVLKDPLWVDFDNKVQTETGIHVSALRRGFTAIEKQSGLIIKKIVETEFKRQTK